MTNFAQVIVKLVSTTIEGTITKKTLLRNSHKGENHFTFFLRRNVLLTSALLIKNFIKRYQKFQKLN